MAAVIRHGGRRCASSRKTVQSSECRVQSEGHSLRRVLFYWLRRRGLKRLVRYWPQRVLNPLLREKWKPLQRFKNPFVAGGFEPPAVQSAEKLNTGQTLKPYYFPERSSFTFASAGSIIF